MTSALKTDRGTSWTSWPRLLGTIVALVVLLFAILFGVIAAMHPDPAHDHQRLVAVFFVGSALGELCAVGLLAWLLWRRGVHLRDLGLGSPTNWSAVAAGLVLGGGYAGLTAAVTPGVTQTAFTVTGLKLVAILTTVLIAGAAEEIIFRGYVMTALASMGYCPTVQVLASAVGFGLVHAIGPAEMLSSGILGAGLAIVYLLGRRSLTPVIIAHMLVNLIIEPGLMLHVLA